MGVGVMEDSKLKLMDHGYVSQIHWVTWETGTPKDRDEDYRGEF